MLLNLRWNVLAMGAGRNRIGNEPKAKSSDRSVCTAPSLRQ